LEKITPKISYMTPQKSINEKNKVKKTNKKNSKKIKIKLEEYQI